jgi:hypothetical protein
MVPTTEVVVFFIVVYLLPALHFQLRLCQPLRLQLSVQRLYQRFSKIVPTVRGRRVEIMTPVPIHAHSVYMATPHQAPGYMYVMPVQPNVPPTHLPKLLPIRVHQEHLTTQRLHMDIIVVLG